MELSRTATSGCPVLRDVNREGKRESGRAGEEDSQEWLSYKIGVHWA
jgi:hypothetical protein